MQDVLLDDLGRGVAELGEIARTIQREIAVGSAVADEVASKTDALNAKLKSANRRLDEVIEQVFFRFCNSQTLLTNTTNQSLRARVEGRRDGARSWSASSSSLRSSATSFAPSHPNHARGGRVSLCRTHRARTNVCVCEALPFVTTVRVHSMQAAPREGTGMCER